MRRMERRCDELSISFFFSSLLDSAVINMNDENADDDFDSDSFSSSQAIGR